MNNRHDLPNLGKQRGSKFVMATAVHTKGTSTSKSVTNKRIDFTGKNEVGKEM